MFSRDLHTLERRIHQCVSLDEGEPRGFGRAESELCLDRMPTFPQNDIAHGGDPLAMSLCGGVTTVLIVRMIMHARIKA